MLSFSWSTAQVRTHGLASLQERLPSETNHRAINPELSDKSCYGKVCPTRSLFEQQQFNSQLWRFCCNLSAAKSRCKRWKQIKITNVLCHPGLKQHFKIFRIEANFSREQCQLMPVISKQSISLPGHSFTTTCYFEITWVKANQPDKIASILWHTWLKIFFQKPPFCDTHVTQFLDVPDRPWGSLRH